MYKCLIKSLLLVDNHVCKFRVSERERNRDQLIDSVINRMRVRLITIEYFVNEMCVQSNLVAGFWIDRSIAVRID